MYRNPFTVPAKPKHITLDTLPQLFAHNRARFGGFSMTITPPEPAPPAPAPSAPAQRPDGVTEEEWNALGDPGRAAILREREARQAAERALAASRARPAPPAPAPKPPADPKPPTDPPKDQAGNVDVAAIVQQAVEAAVKPFRDAEEQRKVDEAATRVRTSVLDAAKTRLHDASDAIAHIDLTQVLDGNGQADPAKVTAALDDLVTRKPHLAKVVDDRRYAEPGAGPTPGGSTPPINDRVKDKLASMQQRAGIKFADF